MSETTLVQLVKRRSELENELSSTTQKEATLEKELKTLEEEVAAQLEEKIKAKSQTVERLESTKSDLERRLKELKEHSEPSQMQEEPSSKGKELGEQQTTSTEAVHLDEQTQQTGEEKEKHMEDAASEHYGKSCSHCGADNKTDAVFCEKCGKKVD